MLLRFLSVLDCQDNDHYDNWNPVQEGKAELSFFSHYTII